jgi:16S rRNA (cytosine967-C5)-methyltransferase
VRRHPDIKLLRRASDLQELARVQGRMLDALWPLLKPGGRLVYTTCSVLRSENTEVVEAFAARRPEVLLPAFGAARHFQGLTGQANADGFYYACLTRAAG